MIRQFPSLHSVLVALVVVWAPLPFASVTPTFRMPLQLAVLALVVVGLWSDARRRRLFFSGAARTAWVPILCLVGMAALAGLQSLRSPGVEEALAARGTGADGAAQGSWLLPISWAPDASRAAALGWLVVAAALMSGALLASRRERRLVLGAVLAAACFQTIYGGPRFLGGTSTIWGVPVADAEGRFRGTFVNPNHAAFFLAMAVPICAAWIWLSTRRMRDGDYGRDWPLRVGLPLVILVLLLGGIVLTQSRGGAFVALATLAVQGLAVSRHRRLRGWIAGAVVLALLGVLILRQSGGGLLRRIWELRIGADAGRNRLEVYRQVLEIWSDHPIWGAGLGSFRAVFSAYAGPEVRGDWWNAHSDWLELAATGGAVALGLILVAGLIVLRTLVRRLDLISRHERATSLGVLGVVVSASLSSLVDFGLAMPANQVVFAVLVGLGIVPHAHARRARRSDPEDQRPVGVEG